MRSNLKSSSTMLPMSTTAPTSNPNLVSNIVPIYSVTKPESKVKNFVYLTFWLVFLIGVCFAGGLFNRYRGGWSPFNNSHQGDNGNVVTHNAIDRLFWSVPAGIIFFVCSLMHFILFTSKDLEKKSDHFIAFMKLFIYALLFTALTFFCLFVGWGAYFSIARGNRVPHGREGIFDYIVGQFTNASMPNLKSITKDDPVALPWSFFRLWLRDFSGMSLRGLVWTIPSGTLLLLVNSWSGWGFMLSGVCMGLIYELGWDIPIPILDFQQGIELSEFMWGFFLTFSLIVNILGYYPGSTSTRSFNNFGFNNKSSSKFWTFLIVVLGFALFLSASIVYGFVKEPDMRKKNQTWLGILVSAGWLLIVGTLYVMFSIISHVKENGYTLVTENEEQIFKPADSNTGFRERFSMDMGYGTTINTHDDDDDDESFSDEFGERIERKTPSLSWRMVSLFAIILRFLSIFCFVVVIFTSITSCIWYYGNFDPTAGDS